ncbi:hypothetical protein BaRGS_00023161, partial [Batillaria attramentaria]
SLKMRVLLFSIFLAAQICVRHCQPTTTSAPPMEVTGTTTDNNPNLDLIFGGQQPPGGTGSGSGILDQILNGGQGNLIGQTNPPFQSLNFLLRLLGDGENENENENMRNFGIGGPGFGQSTGNDLFRMLLSDGEYENENENEGGFANFGMGGPGFGNFGMGGPGFGNFGMGGPGFGNFGMGGPGFGNFGMGGPGFGNFGMSGPGFENFGMGGQGFGNFGMGGPGFGLGSAAGREALCSLCAYNELSNFANRSVLHIK